jgi:hypothetical protein
MSSDHAIFSSQTFRYANESLSISTQKILLLIIDGMVTITSHAIVPLKRILQYVLSIFYSVDHLRWHRRPVTGSSGDRSRGPDH